MKILHELFVPIAQELPIGNSTRVAHCGSGKDMIISHEHEGYSAYCFKCKAKGFKYKSTISLCELYGIREASNRELMEVEMPSDCTSDIPDREQLWLMGCGVTAQQQEYYGIKYSPSLRRVILPIWEGDTLLYLQARSCDNAVKPKYLNPLVNKSNILFRSRQGIYNTVVITEDILSAIRVGSVLDAVSPMGTALSLAQAAQLAVYDKVLIWLDNDQAGYSGAIDMQKVLRPIVPCMVIHSSHDPKYYNDDDIIKIVSPHI